MREATDLRPRAGSTAADPTGTDVHRSGPSRAPVPRTRRFCRARQLFLVALGWAVAGCVGEGPPEPAEAPSVVNVRGGLRIVGSPTEIEAPDARVGFVTPAEGQRFATGEPVEVHVRLSGFALGLPTPGGEQRGILRDARGQHLHLVLNDEPYRVLHEPGEPLLLEDLPTGTHVLRVFPATDWHEAVRTPGAFATRKIHVEREGTPPAENASAGAGAERAPARRQGEPDGPLLTYSRPVGSYEGADADSILVDFHLAGVRLEPDGYRVRLTVEGVGEATLVRWVPHLLVGLPDGEHRVRLELVDPRGVPVSGASNRTARTIRVRRGGG